jgi:hypothetical protein
MFNLGALRAGLPLRPSEYWRRHVVAGQPLGRLCHERRARAGMGLRRA